METTFVRSDGRHLNDLRSVQIVPNYLKMPLGSAMISMGDTKVICTVSHEERVPPFLVGKGKGWLTAEYSMLPGSSSRRIARESATGRPNSRGREIQRLIGRSLRAIVDLEKLGENTLFIDCDVIQADGGTRTASITGAYVALVEAVKTLMNSGVIDADPLINQMAAISVGVVDGRLLLDLCYEEDARAQTDMNVVMTGTGGMIEIQGTAEGSPFSREQAIGLLDLAAGGIGNLLEEQKSVLENL
ncbi:MAG: ribonuclease PH [Candidatus Latescibacterota bacterium]